MSGINKIAAGPGLPTDVREKGKDAAAVWGKSGGKTKELFSIAADLSDYYTAQVRANIIACRISRLLNNSKQYEIKVDKNNNLILANSADETESEVLVTVTTDDAKAEGKSRQQLAEEWKDKIITFLKSCDPQKVVELAPKSTSAPAQIMAGGRTFTLNKEKGVLEYRVKSGDNLSDIWNTAQATGLKLIPKSINELADFNGIKDINYISPQQIIKFKVASPAAVKPESKPVGASGERKKDKTVVRGEGKVGNVPIEVKVGNLGETRPGYYDILINGKIVIRTQSKNEANSWAAGLREKVIKNLNNLKSFEIKFEKNNFMIMADKKEVIRIKSEYGGVGLGTVLAWVDNLACAIGRPELGEIDEGILKTVKEKISRVFNPLNRDNIYQGATKFSGKIYDYGFNCQEFLAKALLAAGIDYHKIYNSAFKTYQKAVSGLEIIKVLCGSREDVNYLKFQINRSTNLNDVAGRIIKYLGEIGVGVFQMEGGGFGHTGFNFLHDDGRLTAFHSGGFTGNYVHEEDLVKLLKTWINKFGSIEFFVGTPDPAKAAKYLADKKISYENIKIDLPGQI